MALPPEPSLNAFHGVATGVPAFALIVTVLRLYYRIKRKLAWWDDLLIGFAALWMVLLVIFIWITTTEGLRQLLKIVSYYMATYTFTLANYFARLSILLGILRIAPNPKTRVALKCMAGFFVAIMCVLMAQKLWVCEGNSEMARTWKKQPDPSCHLGLQVAITELVTDIISDAMLVITPLTFLSRSKLKPSQKRRLYAIFGASLATTITSIVQDYLILAAGGLRELTASMIEVSVAIIVANLPVIVSWIYRLRNYKRDEESRSHSRFATDYDHNRRARPSAWAVGTKELTSSSDRAANSKQQLSSLGPGVAIQLSEVRRGATGNEVLDLRGTRRTERELDDDDDEDKIYAWDEGDTKRAAEFDPERSYDKKHSRTPHSRGGISEVDFSVSAISYSDGKGGRRDAEYDIDIVDDLSDRTREDRRLSAHRYPPDVRPFTQPQLQSQHPVPIALTTDVAMPSPSPSESSPNDYTSFPPPALNRPTLSVPPASRPAYNHGTVSMPSPVPTASPGLQSSTGFFGALKRSGSQGGRLNLGLGSGQATPTYPVERDQQNKRNNSSSRSRSPARASRSVFGGLFGSGNGVLVQQQVTITADPDPEYEAQQGRGRADSEARSRGRH